MSEAPTAAPAIGTLGGANPDPLASSRAMQATMAELKAEAVATAAAGLTDEEKAAKAAAEEEARAERAAAAIAHRGAVGLERYRALIQAYLRWNMTLIRLDPGIKDPIKGVRWSRVPGLTEVEAMEWLARGGNLGVDLLRSRMIDLDAENAAATTRVMRAGFHPTFRTAKSLVEGHVKAGGSHTLLWAPEGGALEAVSSDDDAMQVRFDDGGLIDVLGGRRYGVLPPSYLSEVNGEYMAMADGALDGPDGQPAIAPMWLFDPAAPGCPPNLEAIRGVLAPKAPRDLVELDARSAELTAAIDQVPWVEWIAGDARLSDTGDLDGCGCPIYSWTGADHAKSATLHDDCAQGSGAHIWSGTMIAALGIGEHVSRLDLAVALRGESRSKVAGSVGIRLGGEQEFDAVRTFEDAAEAAARHAAEAERLAEAGDVAAAAGAHAWAAHDTAAVRRHQAELQEIRQQAGEVMIGAGSVVGLHAPVSPVTAPTNVDRPAEVAVVPDGLPVVDPRMPEYRQRAAAEVGSGAFDIDWTIPPGALIPQDLRPLREAVLGPRATAKPVLVPARDAPVAQALAKAVGGTKLLRDVERSTRAAQANLSWDGTRWVNDPDAAGVVVDALLSTHMFDSDPAVKQQKLLVLGQRKPEPEEEQAQLEMAQADALRRGQAFDSGKFVPQPVLFHDQKWADAATRVAGLAQIIGRQPEVAVTETRRFDADSRVLAAEGGYIRLGTDADTPFTVTTPDPAALITKKLGAAFDPKATCPEWMKFLEQVQPDPEARGYLQRSTGMGLLGSVRGQIILVFTGEGANGKGVYTNVLLKLLGEYGVALNSRTLTAKSQDDHPAALMPLRGARIAVVDELPEGVVWAANLIKHLTGGGVITARWMNENPQSWDPTHTIILTTNGHPLVPPGEKAFWRRYREIPFTQSFATTADELASGGYAGMADEGLEERLMGELPGILNWVLDGYRDYLVRGLDEPEAVLEAGRKAKADSSSFASFAASMFEVTGNPEDRIRTREVWNGWTTYRRDESEMSHQRPNSERDLVPILIKELGKKVSHQKSTGGKSPACLLGVKWSEEGQELVERTAGGAMLPDGLVQGHVMPRTGRRLTPVVPPGPAA